MAQQIECPRCEGTGHINEYAFIADGICFKCNGTGKINAPRTRKPSKREMERKAAKEARVAAEVAEYEAMCDKAFSDPRTPHSHLVKAAPGSEWYKTQLIEAYRYHQKWGWGDLTDKYSDVVGWWAA